MKEKINGNPSTVRRVAFRRVYYGTGRKKLLSLLSCLIALTVLFGAVSPVRVSAAEEGTAVSDSNLVRENGEVHDSDIFPTGNETGMNDADGLSQDHDTDDGITAS